MKVYEILKHKVETSILPIKVQESSIIIIGLLHDICKVNFYKVDYRNANHIILLMIQYHMVMVKNL